jgi:putative acetyltransferase
MLRIEPITTEGPALKRCRLLFSEYQQMLGEDLCFQGFEKELANPLLKYGPPAGLLYLAYWNDEVAGCIALQPLASAGVCEMKRLYVRLLFRRHEIGRMLCEELLKQAIALDYHTMKLDTLQQLQPAIRLYESLGFTHTTAYYHNPLPGVVYMEKQLTATKTIS